MFVPGYKHAGKHVPFVVVLALISGLFILSPETAEARGAKSSEDLLMGISYRNKYCDTDACKMPVAIKFSSLMEFSYCPDNTCDNFSIPISADKELFYDFVLMYLYYKSGYIYLKEVKEKYWMEHVDDIAGKYVTGKSGPLSESVIDCVLKAMAERNDIFVDFIRLDGNSRQTNRVELQDCKWK